MPRASRLPQRKAFSRRSAPVTAASPGAAFVRRTPAVPSQCHSGSTRSWQRSPVPPVVGTRCSDKSRADSHVALGQVEQVRRSHGERCSIRRLRMGAHLMSHLLRDRAAPGSLQIPDQHYVVTDGSAGYGQAFAVGRYVESANQFAPERGERCSLSSIQWPAPNVRNPCDRLDVEQGCAIR
jgi:hypothetical protein